MNNMAMTKMKPIHVCELEERHVVVHVGQGYKNNQACASFVEFIALDQQRSLVDICLVPIFTAYRQMVLLIMDTSKMSLFLVVYLDHHAELVDRRVNIFFSVQRPCSGDAN